ncbi:MAG: VOC family protein [Proteobacteria bacterium]|nr:VOC family protein [Pseudomonadota bacterium]
MKLSDCIGKYAIVAKVDVSDLESSVSWYRDKLCLTVDDRFTTETWVQLRVGIPYVAIGLNLSASNVGTAGGVTTFVVDDIEFARNNLIAKGVEVSAIEEVAKGVKLAFFSDPDGNHLGLRQNSKGHPTVANFSA